METTDEQYKIMEGRVKELTAILGFLSRGIMISILPEDMDVFLREMNGWGLIVDRTADKVLRVYLRKPTENNDGKQEQN